MPPAYAQLGPSHAVLAKLAEGHDRFQATMRAVVASEAAMHARMNDDLGELGYGPGDD